MTEHIFVDPQWIERNNFLCENQGRCKLYKNNHYSPRSYAYIYKYWKQFIKSHLLSLSQGGYIKKIEEKKKKSSTHLRKASKDHGTNSKWTQEEIVDNSRAHAAFAGQHTCRRAAALALQPSVHRLRAHALQHKLIQHLWVQGKVRLHFLIRQTCKTATAISPGASLVQISEQWDTHSSQSFRRTVRVNRINSEWNLWHALAWGCADWQRKSLARLE